MNIVGAVASRYVYASGNKYNVIWNNHLISIKDKKSSISHEEWLCPIGIGVQIQKNIMNLHAYRERAHRIDQICQFYIKGSKRKGK